jgi:hypothetical protein
VTTIALKNSPELEAVQNIFHTYGDKKKNVKTIVVHVPVNLEDHK